MKLTMEEKLEICKEHMIKNKSLSNISEEHDNYNIGEIKYLVIYIKDMEMIHL